MIFKKFMFNKRACFCVLAATSFAACFASDAAAAGIHKSENARRPDKYPYSSEYWENPIVRKCRGSGDYATRGCCRNSCAQEEIHVYIVQGSEEPAPAYVQPEPEYVRPALPAPDYNDWYIGAKFIQNFAFFKETRFTDGIFTGTGYDTQRHSAAPQMGGAFFAGRKFYEDWRAEFELGYLGKYSDFGKGVEFSLRTPYAHLGVNYNTTESSWGWLYAGLGLGAAFPRTTISDNIGLFLAGGKDETRISPLGAIMLGWRIHFVDTWFFDLGYKFMGYQGTKHTRQYICSPTSVLCVPGTVHDFTDDLGFISNHSITLGIAKEF